MFDIKNNLKLYKGFSPAVRTATATTQACDLKGFNGAMIIAPIGATSDTLSGSVYWTFTITHSDDDSSYSTVTSNNDVTGGSLDSSTNGWLKLDLAGECQQVYGIGYVGGKRYIKVVCTKTGTHSSGTIIGVDFAKGIPLSAPVTTDSNDGA